MPGSTPRKFEKVMQCPDFGTIETHPAKKLVICACRFRILQAGCRVGNRAPRQGMRNNANTLSPSFAHCRGITDSVEHVPRKSHARFGLSAASAHYRSLSLFC